MGGVPSQHIEGKWKPIAYQSQSLTEAERNNEIHDREMLAIMEALEDWRQYLLRAKHRVEVWTDHLNLTYFRQANELNRRQARWNTELQSYDLLLVHKPGALMKKADILSRLAQLESGEQDNLQVTLLPERVFAKAAVVFDPDPQNLDKIRSKHSKQDPSVTKALRGHLPGWRESDQIITFQDRIYIPKDEALRGEVIKAHHDHPSAGHPGHYKTLELVSRNYYWPSMSREIKGYVEGCDACQRTKSSRQRAAAPLHPHDVPSGPWATISMDLIGSLA